MGIFDININNLFKLYMKGDITALYRKMYDLAVDIAVFEMKQKSSQLIHSADKSLDSKEYFLDIDKKLQEFKHERIEHHMKQMERLLLIRAREGKSK